MNYLEIVLQGYFNANNREFLEKFFLREFKNAEKEQFFEADEFFNGCIKVIEGWEKHLQGRVFERKNELYLSLNAAKNGTMEYGNLEGKTIEQKRQETIEYCEQELKEVRPDGIGSMSFTVHLHSLTNGRISHNMSYNELLTIKLAIQTAKTKTIFEKIQPQNEALPPQPTEKPKPEPKETDLSEKIKKHFSFLLGNCPRKGIPILNNEQDFENLVKWTTSFFENNFEVPKISEPIKSVNTNKYITQLAFQILFDELRITSFHSQKIKSNTQLFNLWESSFLDYKDDKEDNFYKVRKTNDNGTNYEIEVKKLMLINQ